MLLHLNFHASEGSPVSFYDTDFEQEDYTIKVSSSAFPVVVKDYSTHSYEVLPQNEYGTVLRDDHFTTFELEIEDETKLKLLIRMYLQEECIGHAYVTSNQLVDCAGQIHTALVSPKTHDLIADVAFDYMVIKPWRDNLLSSVVINQTYFNGEFVYMGHRGRGKTANRKALVLENTVDSFLSAHDLGAALVELDIQMTKDLVPVIFHDFSAKIITGGEKQVEVPIKELNLAELQSLKMDFAREGAGSHYDDRFLTLFPTLAEFLQNTPESLGVMVEIKYPYKCASTGKKEMDHFYARNEVVDLILDVVMNYQGRRHIVFASFDPDICLMVQYKQSKYHVVLITAGENDKYQYTDIRNRTRGIAASFALTNNLLGISIMSDPLVNKQDELQKLVKVLKNQDKHLFTWGSANSDPKFVDCQQISGVSAVISDHLELLNIETGRHAIPCS